jgi:membrane protein YqaA with SNARE-associated domain
MSSFISMIYIIEIYCRIFHFRNYLLQKYALLSLMIIFLKPIQNMFTLVVGWLLHFVAYHVLHFYVCI